MIAEHKEEDGPQQDNIRLRCIEWGTVEADSLRFQSNEVVEDVCPAAILHFVVGRLERPLLNLAAFGGIRLFDNRNEAYQSLADRRVVCLAGEVGDGRVQRMVDLLAVASGLGLISAKDNEESLPSTVGVASVFIVELLLRLSCGVARQRAAVNTLLPAPVRFIPKLWRAGEGDVAAVVVEQLAQEALQWRRFPRQAL
ncbi:unnamed protein product, partial [Phaeothamnion confervicola]